MKIRKRCPHCRGSLLGSSSIVPGHVVIGCTACQIFRLAQSDQWALGGPGMIEALRNQAKELELAKRPAKQTTIDWKGATWT